MKRSAKYSLFVAVLLLFGCQREAKVDPLLRSKVDGLNKEAFIHRYRDPDTCLILSQRALEYIHDSLPSYLDGELRARNNMAFAHFLLSRADSANLMLDRVERLAEKPRANMRNADIERVIARLIRARLLQRNCQIAESYRLLYDIGTSGVLSQNPDNLLHAYAQTEYYITLLTLNFHYRNGKEADVRTIIDEVEKYRPRLRVDYAQDMALNYALAYGLQSAGESRRALEYCERNYDILDRNPSAFCRYNYANTLQMTASAMKSLPGEMPPDTILALYDRARRCFFDYGDPYQMLGGVTSTARYALLIGDTLFAHEILAEWRSMRGTWMPFSAPKMELGYFDIIIRSGMAESPDENRRWYEHRCELQDYIVRNETEDFILQNTLEASQRRSRQLSIFSAFALFALLALLALTLLLWRNALRLRREKQQLEEAKRRDVERTANVETCLSVMRHDISPFIGYLRNPDLTPELRSEVLEQLLRTFDNIKNWTSLSIPSGLAFTASRFALQEVFDDVRSQVVSPADGVELRFEPTDAMLRGDRLLVTFLLRNLVNNALQHTAVGSVKVTVEEQDAEEGDFVDITVSDTGSGMTEEQLENLFSASRPTGDHGFGLILCRYIVKKHDDLIRRGCKIWAESTPGKGTAMHVVLSS